MSHQPFGISLTRDFSAWKETKIEKFLCPLNELLNFFKILWSFVPTIFLKSGLFRFLTKCPTSPLAFYKPEVPVRGKRQKIEKFLCPLNEFFNIFELVWSFVPPIFLKKGVFRFLIKCPKSPLAFYKLEVPVRGKRQKLKSFYVR